MPIIHTKDGKEIEVDFVDDYARLLEAYERRRMWEIDDDGNAFNDVTGERIFVSVSVLKQELGCGGHRKNLCDFKTTYEAEDFIKKLVDKLNAEQEK